MAQAGWGGKCRVLHWLAQAGVRSGIVPCLWNLVVKAAMYDERV